MATDFKVEIFGLQATKRLMRELEPDLLKQMNKEIREGLAPVAARAKTLIPTGPPISGWGASVFRAESRSKYSPWGSRWNYSRLEWDSARARRGIVIRQGGGRRRGVAARAAWQIRSNDPAAAVFELMGRGKSNVSMVRNVGRRFPADGRALYKAYDNLGGDDRFERLTVDTIRRFEKVFNARLDVAGGA